MLFGAFWWNMTMSNKRSLLQLFQILFKHGMHMGAFSERAMILSPEHNSEVSSSAIRCAHLLLLSHSGALRHFGSMAKGSMAMTQSSHKVTTPLLCAEVQARGELNRATK